MKLWRDLEPNEEVKVGDRKLWANCYVAVEEEIVDSLDDIESYRDSCIFQREVKLQYTRK